MRKIIPILVLTISLACAGRGIVQKTYVEPEETVNETSPAVKAPVESESYPESYTQSEIEDFPFDVKDIIDLLEEEESADIIDKILSFRKDYDIPVVFNEKVKFFIKYFTTKHREIFKRWLERSGRYIDLMKTILKKHNLPQDLVYLALIESGFNPHAYSRARATGPWQFIRSTARRYGLRVDFWVDERRDPIKSTLAAARYLKDLYDIFGSWYLAAAGYNAGEGKIIRAMRKHGSKEFWELAKTRYLRRETRDYVPKMIAAAIIAKNPEIFGFTDLNYAEPFTFEVVKVPSPMDLAVVSRRCGIGYKEIKKLNPELRRWFTPPDVRFYYLRVPVGKGRSCGEKLRKIKTGKKYVFKRHLIRKGDTLSTIAYMYRSSVREIMRLNGIRNPRRLKPGRVIYVPAHPWEKPRKFKIVKKRERYRLLNIKGRKRVLYTVKPGDTLWEIARAYGVSVRDIKRWNRIPRNNRIMPGDVIAIYVKKERRGNAGHIYVVKEGDTLWDIARKFGVSVKKIKRVNNLRTSVIYPGMRIKIPVEEAG